MDQRKEMNRNAAAAAWRRDTHLLAMSMVGGNMMGGPRNNDEELLWKCAPSLFSSCEKVPMTVCH